MTPRRLKDEMSFFAEPLDVADVSEVEDPSLEPEARRSIGELERDGGCRLSMGGLEE